MADPHALPATAGQAPVTEDAFLADRIKFWDWFGGLLRFSVAVVVILLILLTIFLV